MARASTCCASLRRRCWAPSSAASAISPPPRTPFRRRSSRPPCSGREEGVPDNPRGWLIQVAARRMTDQFRADMARRRREAVVIMQAPADAQVVPPPDAGTQVQEDDTLVLLFMCCHRGADAAVGDRADAAGGRRPDDRRDRERVSRAGSDDGAAHQPRQTAHQDLRRSLSHAHRRRARPSASTPSCTCCISSSTRATRAPAGPSLHRSDLSNEAIRLTRAVHRLLPGDGEVVGPAGADAPDRCAARRAHRA